MSAAKRGHILSTARIAIARGDTEGLYEVLSAFMAHVDLGENMLPVLESLADSLSDSAVDLLDQDVTELLENIYAEIDANADTSQQPEARTA